MKTYTKSELLENNYLPYGTTDSGTVIVAKIDTMKIEPGRYYNIRPGSKWENGRVAKVIKIDEGVVICEVAKKNRVANRISWLNGTFEIPFDRFISMSA